MALVFYLFFANPSGGQFEAHYLSRKLRDILINLICEFIYNPFCLLRLMMLILKCVKMFQSLSVTLVYSAVWLWSKSRSWATLAGFQCSGSPELLAWNVARVCRLYVALEGSGRGNKLKRQKLRTLLSKIIRLCPCFTLGRFINLTYFYIIWNNIILVNLIDIDNSFVFRNFSWSAMWLIAGVCLLKFESWARQSTQWRLHQRESTQRYVRG